MTLKVNSAFGVDLLTQMMTYSLGTSPKLEIYSGAIPEVDDNYSYAPGNYTAQKLGTAGTFSLQMLNGILRFNTMPAAFAATGSGTATWFAMYSTSNAARALLGSITDNADGTGVLILDSVNIVSGANITALDLGVRLG